MPSKHSRRPGLHRNPADLQEPLAARAVAGLDGQASDNRVHEGGESLDICVSGQAA